MDSHGWLWLVVRRGNGREACPHPGRDSWLQRFTAIAQANAGHTWCPAACVATAVQVSMPVLGLLPRLWVLIVMLSVE